MRRTTLHVITILFLFLWGCVQNPSLNDTPKPSSDQELAQQTLYRFFDNLHDGKYQEAASLYGGEYETMIAQNPDLDPTDHPALFRNACTFNGLRCMKVKTARLEKQISPTDFRFLVEFQNEDGSLFVLGPCCGANATDMPPQSVFPYTVMKDAQGNFLLLDVPVYVP
jgi:hypothetical protein